MTHKGGEGLDQLEATLGHRFSDRSLIKRALTHTSAPVAATQNYQRLEFLGDRVLALTVAEMLYRAFPEEPEGDLARRLNALVKRETCADVAQELGLGAHIRMAHSEAQSGGRTKIAILGDIAEAVIAAIYLDAGFETASAFVRRHWEGRMRTATGASRDAKTALQEWAQGRGLPTPVYTLVERTGPDHQPRFTIEVAVEGLKPARATGSSKREGEQSAARALIERDGLSKGTQNG